MSRAVICGIFAVFALLGSLWLHFYLPQKQLVEISGVDSKRGENIPGRKTTSAPGAPDAYYINVVKANGVAAPFKNEDTSWGWPPYFKFDAADMQAKAQTLVGKKVVIRYYGWRNMYLGTFPNITSLNEGTEQDSLRSWVRYGIFGFWSMLLIFLFPRYYRLVSGIVLPKE